MTRLHPVRAHVRRSPSVIRFLRSLFRRRPITVNNFKVIKTDLQKVHFYKHAQLAREMGRENPVRMR